MKEETTRRKVSEGRPQLEDSATRGSRSKRRRDPRGIAGRGRHGERRAARRKEGSDRINIETSDDSDVTGDDGGETEKDRGVDAEMVRRSYVLCIEGTLQLEFHDKPESTAQLLVSDLESYVERRS